MGKSSIKSRATEQYSKARRRRKSIGGRQRGTGKICGGGKGDNFGGGGGVSEPDEECGLRAADAVARLRAGARARSCKASARAEKGRRPRTAE